MKQIANPNKIVLITLIMLVAFAGFSQKKPHHNGNHTKKDNHAKQHHANTHHKKKHNHHHYGHLPKRGVIVTAKPKGALLVVHSGHNYHFHNGVWYKPHQGKFIVFRPHLGLRIKVLPVNHHICKVRNRTYYYYYGTYYVKAAANSNEYEVVDVPLGATVKEIPDDYTLEQVDGVDHYIVDDVHYTYNEETEMYTVLSVK